MLPIACGPLVATRETNAVCVWFRAGESNRVWIHAQRLSRWTDMKPITGGDLSRH